MAKKNINDISIDAKTLGGLNSDMYLSCWLALNYDNRDWNNAKSTRVYTYDPTDMELPNSPKGLIYNYGLLLCLFDRDKSEGIQICIPHSVNTTMSIKPIYRFYHAYGGGWNEWRIFTTPGDKITQATNNMTINELNWGGEQLTENQ